MGCPPALSHLDRKPISVMPGNPITRRSFLGAAGATLVAPAILSARSPNEKLKVAVIGVANHSALLLAAAGRLENVVALCDIDETYLDAAARQYPQATKHVDFRTMFDQMHGVIDAVMVGTPDHTHAVAAAAALRLGKHCYCEKPLAHTIYETRRLRQLAGESKAVTQVGTQMHASDNFRRIVELIRSGAIGAVDQVQLWFNRSWGTGKRPKESFEPPPHIHWDQWLGPAPFRPYNPCYLPGHWRCYWDFGGGTFGDMAPHIMDLAFWALELRYPLWIEAEGPPVDAEGCPPQLTVRYDFPARGNQPPVRLTWTDGAEPASLPAGIARPTTGNNILFIGTEGMLWANYDQYKLLPEEKFRDFTPPAPSIAPSIGHFEEFFAACKNGGATSCNFDYSGALTETVLLGTVAYRVGQRLEWNTETMMAAGCPAADALIRPPCRAGWEI